MSDRNGLCYWLALALCFASLPVSAQNIISSDKYYDERQRGSTNVAWLKSDLFGDSINLKDGSVEFNQDDVVLPTNSGLRVAFGRQTPRHPQGLDRQAMPLGAGWEINAPYMVGRYDTRRGWDARGSLQRCSSPDLHPSEWVGPSPDYNTMVMPAKFYWTGININIPGAGFENMLTLTSEHPRPQDGSVYVGSTQGSWRIGCLSSLQNGSGEGFFVRLPNGEKYYFDWMATRNAPDVLANEYYKDQNGDGTAPPYLLVPTSDVFIYATRVEDRMGNYVLYRYDPTNPHRLTSIESSDGARIDIAYDLNGKVSTVRTGSRTWTYRYTSGYWGYVLAEIELPDASKWAFNGDVMWWQMTPMVMPGGFYLNNCSQNPSGYRQSDPESAGVLNAISFKHPSGAVGDFKLRALIHGSDNTPGGCGIVGTSSSNFSFGSHGEPNAYVAHSLTSKRISGPGGVDSVWTYTYTPNWSFAKNCSTGCYSITSMADPMGAVTTYTFGNSYTDNYGDLMNEAVLVNGQVVSSKRYVKKAASGDFPEYYGGPLTYGNRLQYKIRPVQTVELIVGELKYVRTVEQFDSFARPIRVTKSSAPY